MTAVRLALILVLFVGLGPLGCVTIEGGAVELSWQVRLLDGEPLEAGCNFEFVQLQADGLECASEATDAGSPCPEQVRFPAWSCSDRHGSTSFKIPEGRYALSIVPECEAGVDSIDRALYRVPDPIVRDITNGDVAQIGALLIEVGTKEQLCPQGN